MLKCEVCKTPLGLHVYYMFIAEKKEHIMCDACYGKYLQEKKNERARQRV